MTAANVRISRRRSGSSAFTMRLLSMCFVKKTSGVGPRRARRCVSYNSRFRSAGDTARLCVFTREPIISICCPAIAEAAIAHLTRSRWNETLCRSLQRYEPGRDRYWRRGLVLQSCLSPERRWDNPGPITCLLHHREEISLTKSSAPLASSHFATADSASVLALSPQPASSSKPQTLSSGPLHGTHPSPAGLPKSES